ncbi:MAG: 23S rRNA (adenine(2030)-N(6))-methyltransferase RlmJ [Treponema sp.]|nr:23S rRNA (adenine(2030)-N(6))-methyltransferase RlmJ [Treponema sp.]
MLSYQHEYHAGNHADLLKHVCLTLVLESMCRKDKPYTIIDSHSGAGLFDLNDERLLKTGEAHKGIERLFSAAGSADPASLPGGIASYLALERPYFERGFYAGSARIERHFARSCDKIHLVEKHPQVLEKLRQNINSPLITSAGLEKAESVPVVHDQDSYKALAALVPPLVKRGVVLCDPSYEDASDYAQVAQALKTVRRKWNTAVILLWYPLLTRRKKETAQLLTELEDFGKLGTTPCESFSVELQVADPSTMDDPESSHLYGSGMFVMNPVWQLKENLEECRDYLLSVVV